MKKIFIKLSLAGAIIISLNACSTPEERATIVEGADTLTTTTSPSSDSFKATSRNMDPYDTTGISGPGDSASHNQKMESFRHTPIDTITSKRDSTRKK